MLFEDVLADFGEFGPSHTFMELAELRFQTAGCPLTVRGKSERYIDCPPVVDLSSGLSLGFRRESLCLHFAQ